MHPAMLGMVTRPREEKTRDVVVASSPQQARNFVALQLVMQVDVTVSRCPATAWEDYRSLRVGMGCSRTRRQVESFFFAAGSVGVGLWGSHIGSVPRSYRTFGSLLWIVGVMNRLCSSGKHRLERAGVHGGFPLRIILSFQ